MGVGRLGSVENVPAARGEVIMAGIEVATGELVSTVGGNISVNIEAGPRVCQTDGEYIEELWICYQKGIKEIGLPEKELFKALAADMLKQVKTIYSKYK